MRSAARYTRRKNYDATDTHSIIFTLISSLFRTRSDRWAPVTETRSSRRRSVPYFIYHREKKCPAVVSGPGEFA